MIIGTVGGGGRSSFICLFACFSLSLSFCVSLTGYAASNGSTTRMSHKTSKLSRKSLLNTMSMRRLSNHEPSNQIGTVLNGARLNFCIGYESEYLIVSGKSVPSLFLLSKVTLSHFTVT